MLVWAVLVAADDGGGIDVAVGGAVLGIADALAAALMELVATGHGAAADGGIGLEGDAHQAELQQARPAGPARGSGAAAGDNADGVGGVWRGGERGRDHTERKEA